MGGDGDDTISGGGAFDVLMGQNGDDSIKGDGGSDHLVGGPGADRLDGGEVRGERDNMILNPAFVDADGDGTDDIDPAITEMILTTDLDWAVYRPGDGRRQRWTCLKAGAPAAKPWATGSSVSR